jgi:hypothetical protein
MRKRKRREVTPVEKPAIMKRRTVEGAAISDLCSV